MKLISLTRRLLPGLVFAATALTTLVVQAAAAEPPKVLRYAFQVAETGFDPSQLSDIYSRTITAAIFEALYGYDQLARPVQIKPLVAAAMPEISADFRTYTVRIRPGIYFAQDAAFKGQPRELTAQDFVYSFKRFADPALNSPGWSSFAEAGLVGLAAVRQRAMKDKKPFNYDSRVEGLLALDRYTLQLKTEQPRPRLLSAILTGNDLYGAMAREVVEAYGEKISEHPVGTGPFVLADWRRSSRIVLARNPDYRERYYDAQATADDAAGQAIQAHFKGRRIPMLDRVEIAIIESVQPRWLSFLNGEADFIERVPAEFISQAMPNGHVAPNLAQKGVQGFLTLASDVGLSVFNMDDAIVGGMTPDKVALRRAIGLSIDLEREIRLARRGQAIPAQSAIPPNTTGYTADFKSEMSEFSPARAMALLDLYGYVDRDGDGWRDLPGAPGSPVQALELVRSTQPDAQSRQLDELWQKNLSAVGLRVRFKAAKWPENLKSVRGGNFMIWGVGSSSDQPDSQSALQRMYGPASGGQNLSRFKNAQFDRIYDQMQGLSDGPERLALLRQAQLIAVAYMPYKAHVHRMYTDMAQPWLIGYRRAVFWQDWWQYVDIDTSRLPP